MAKFFYTKGKRTGVVFSSQEAYSIRINLKKDMGPFWWMHYFLYKRLYAIVLKKTAKEFLNEKSGVI